MKILVAIANYGDTSGKFIHQLIDSYRSFSCEVDIVALSNVEKEVAEGVEVRVGLPISNPWSLPFSHRDLFVERQDDYDLFIYSEDDTLITEAHVDAFLEADKVLPKDHIAGFVRHEIDPSGEWHYSTVHGHYHWEPASAFEAGGDIFARYTNDHSAAYILTRDKLKVCIDSGGFLVPPHEGRYDMLCSAATDPYTRCGLRKVLCISRLQEFSLHHLPNKYIGKIGLAKSEVDLHVQKLTELHCKRLPAASLLNGRARVRHTARYDRDYFTPEIASIVSAMPSRDCRVLSVGCDAGCIEAAIVAAGHKLDAIPLDPVIAESAMMRGVQVLGADLSDPVRDLSDNTYDIVLMNFFLPYVADPPATLRAFKDALRPSGRIAVSFRNWQEISEIRTRTAYRRVHPEEQVGDYESSGVHYTSSAVIADWLSSAGMRAERTIYDISQKRMQLSRCTFGFADRWIARTGTVLSSPI